MNGEQTTPEIGSLGPTFPVPLTQLVGRETELEAVVALLGQPDVHLVTLTGPGGVGKTRLSIEVARRAAPSFSDGAVFVNLAAVTEPTFVASAIAQTLGIADTTAPPEERLETVLANRNQLLVLDNFEHVVDAAPIVSRLITAAPRLTVLATSRVRLRLSFEMEYAVPPLVLPAGGESLVVIASVESVRLFAERARAVDPAFDISEQNSGSVADICQRLDGLPLAIELAASKLKVLPIAALAARLDHQLPLLVGGSRDQPLRHQSMRQTIAWSYDLLQAVEQRLLRWLAVFVDGCSWEAIEATGAAIGLDASQTVEALSGLIDNALIRRVQTADDVPRFRMLEPIKDFAFEELDASDELQAAQEAHAVHFLGIVERGVPIFGPMHLARVEEHDRESGNLHAALDWCIGHGQAERSLRMANGMAFAHWTARGRFREQRFWMERVLAMPSVGLEALRADAWMRLGWAEMILGNLQAARVAAEQGLADARSSGHDEGVAWALNVMGLVDVTEQHYAAGRAHLEESLSVARSTAFQPLVANVQSSLGYSYAWCGDYENARFHFAEGVSILQALGDPWTLADAQLDLAYALRELGHTQESARFFREALWRELEFRDDYMLAASLDDAAAAAIDFGTFEQASILFGVAARMRERTGHALQETLLAEHASMVETARSNLGAQAFADAWARGEALSLEEAVELADRVVGAWAEDASAAEPPQDGYGLSQREREVLRLLAMGKSNRAIAEELFISVPTVKVHVRSILTKLGLESRTAAAAFAIHHHLT